MTTILYLILKQEGFNTQTKRCCDRYRWHAKLSVSTRRRLYMWWHRITRSC